MGCGPRRQPAVQFAEPRAPTGGYGGRVPPVAASSSWVPETVYARNGETHIAYQTFGEGEVTFVGVPGIVSNIEVIWEDPEARAWLTRLGSFVRMVHFDKRGQGMSDRDSGVPTLDDRVEDLMAVIEAVGADRVALG